MSALLAVEDFAEFLGGVDDDELPVCERIIDQVEALFCAQANRRERAFVGAQTARVEVHDSADSAILHLDYPIATLTSVVLGYVPGTPDETLVVNDAAKLAWGAGSTRLQRTDGGTFGGVGKPRYVHVTYNTQADLPADVALAVQSVAASIYRRRGSEDASSERLGGFQADFAQIAAADPLWKLALQGQYLPAFATG